MSELINHTINNKLLINNIIGSGSFSNVYSCKNIINNKEYALKIEFDTTPYKLLTHETKILNYLQNKGINIPNIIWYGKYLNYRCLCITKYEMNLTEYINSNDFTEFEIIDIIQKIINIIQNIHSNFIIHRDIKPENIMIKNNQFYIIDFGFSIFYINDNNTHIINKTSNSIIGSPKYTSIHIHDGNVGSRRDDLISIGYILIESLHKQLPWDVNIENDGTYKIHNILNINNQNKKRFKSISYIESLRVNENIISYLTYLYNLSFEDKPSYEYLINALIRTY
tara:strand:+ start:6537 stop:7382 length:846 start_codon:yes stop_codon:yes gene_type:complete